jgi:hypothetical protein
MWSTGGVVLFLVASSLGSFSDIFVFVRVWERGYLVSFPVSLSN